MVSSSSSLEHPRGTVWLALGSQYYPEWESASVRLQYIVTVWEGEGEIYNVFVNKLELCAQLAGMDNNVEWHDKCGVQNYGDFLSM